MLKAFDEADGKDTIYAQEKDVAIAALARLNMIFHGQEAFFPYTLLTDQMVHTGKQDN